MADEDSELELEEETKSSIKDSIKEWIKYGDKDRVKHGMMVVVNGSIAYAGVFSLTEVAHHSSGKKAKEEKMFNGAIGSIDKIIYNGIPPTKNEFSQIYSDVKNLNKLDLEEISKAQLKDITNHLGTANIIYNSSGTSQKLDLTEALLDVKHQLKEIKKYEIDNLNVLYHISLFLGGVLLLVGGWKAIKRLYKAVLDPHEFP